MSSATENLSKQNKAPELESEADSNVRLEETTEHLEPENDQTGELVTSDTQDYSFPAYRQKNITKKALTAMGGMSLAAGSVNAASLGIGGALLLDYCGEDKMYSLEKAEQLYTQVEDYLEKAEL